MLDCLKNCIYTRLTPSFLRSPSTQGVQDVERKMGTVNNVRAKSSRWDRGRMRKTGDGTDKEGFEKVSIDTGRGTSEDVDDTLKVFLYTSNSDLVRGSTGTHQFRSRRKPRATTINWLLLVLPRDV